MVGGKTLKFVKHCAAMAAVFALSGHAIGNQLPGELVSGQVNAVAGDSSIKVDGKIYRVKSGSPAAQVVRSIAPGQLVDVQLNGPANSSASEVVNVIVRGGGR
jgi:hypothetical protein